MSTDDSNLEIEMYPSGFSSIEEKENISTYSFDGNTEIIAHVVPEGAIQMVAVIKEDETSIEYNIQASNDAVWESNEYGGYDLWDGGEIVANIESPWAVDASGNSIETWYSYDGSVLTQFIDPDGVEYPIVTDPKVGVGRGIYLYFNRYEASSLLAMSAAVAGVGTIYTCEQLIAATAVVPVAGSFVAYACAKIGVAPLVDFFRHMPSVLRRTPACSEVHFWGSGNRSRSAKSVSSSKCQPKSKTWRW